MLRKLHFRRTWFALGIVLLALIVTGSLVPIPSTGLHANDKLVHVSMYFLLMVWFALVVEARHHLRIAIFFASLGLLLEFAQHATGYRSFEWGDVLANFAGIVAGWVLGHTIFSSTLFLLDDWLARFAHRNS